MNTTTKFVTFNYYETLCAASEQGTPLILSELRAELSREKNDPASGYIEDECADVVLTAHDGNDYAVIGDAANGFTVLGVTNRTDGLGDVCEWSKHDTLEQAFAGLFYVVRLDLTGESREVTVTAT